MLANNLWYYTMLQLRRNHTACLQRNLHFHKEIILNQLQIRCYVPSLYLFAETTILLNKQLTKHLQTGCAMAQEASWQPLTTQAWMQSQTSPYGKCGSWNDTSTCFSPWGARWRSWLRHYATNWQVTGSIPDGINGIFQWHNPPSHTMALGSTQPLTEMSTRCVSCG